MAIETSAEFMQTALNHMVTLVQDAVSKEMWPFPPAIFLAPKNITSGFPIVPFPPNESSEERQQFCAALGVAKRDQNVYAGIFLGRIHAGFNRKEWRNQQT